jgi:hypothetical protein
VIRSGKVIHEVVAISSFRSEVEDQIGGAGSRWALQDRRAGNGRSLAGALARLVADGGHEWDDTDIVR